MMSRPSLRCISEGIYINSTETLERWPSGPSRKSGRGLEGVQKVFYLSEFLVRHSLFVVNIEHSTRNDELRSCFLDNLGLKALMGFTTYILVNEM
jgi:hypothetical protein